MRGVAPFPPLPARRHGSAGRPTGALVRPRALQPARSWEEHLRFSGAQDLATIGAPCAIIEDAYGWVACDGAQQVLRVGDRVTAEIAWWKGACGAGPYAMPAASRSRTRTKRSFGGTRAGLPR